MQCYTICYLKKYFFFKINYDPRICGTSRVIFFTQNLNNTVTFVT